VAKEPLTRKDTVEYDKKFLADWNEWCDRQGYVKRQAVHASLIGFMKLTPEQREKVMGEAMKKIGRS
jgi:hypothetical protein